MVPLISAALAVPFGVSAGNETAYHYAARQLGVNAGLMVQPHPLFGLSVDGTWYAHLGQGEWTRATREAVYRSGGPVVLGNRTTWRAFLRAEVLPLRGHLGPFDFDVFIGAGYGLQHLVAPASRGPAPPAGTLTDSWSWHLGTELRRDSIAFRARFEQLHPRVPIDGEAIRRVNAFGLSVLFWVDPRHSPTRDGARR